MTTSGVITYEPTTTPIIEAAFNILGVCQEGEALTPRMYTDGLRAFNMLIQTWSAYPHLWTRVEGSVTMVADQPSYVVSPRALRVEEVRYRINGIDTPMTEMSRSEYFEQPNKTVSPSIPVSFYYDPKVANGTLYLWPAPSAQTISAGYTIHFTYVRFLEIMTETNQTIYLPQQWIEPLTWNLAKRLMSQYPVNDPNLAIMIRADAKEYLDALLAWDNEPASIYFTPSWQGRPGAS